MLNTLGFSFDPLREIVARIETERANTLVGTRPQVDTSKLESAIDHAQRVALRQLSHKRIIYGLTPEEIEIVEDKE